MLEQTDLTFLKRAVHMILTWQHKPKQVPVVHIHGRRDRLLTPSRIQASHWLPTGGHFMIWNEANAVSRIINTELEK
jgi:pimeloyl-ACP methyl ester carboxylesterase